jgi:hypothetical protein
MMNIRWAALPLLLMLWLGVAAARTPGEFRGKIVSPPQGGPEAGSASGCIYVLGRNSMVRKVGVRKAEITYAETVPSNERQQHPAASLLEGAEVRVTASQGADGDWQAKRVEILRTAPSRSDSRVGKI